MIHPFSLLWRVCSPFSPFFLPLLTSFFSFLFFSSSFSFSKAKNTQAATLLLAAGARADLTTKEGELFVVLLLF